MVEHAILVMIFFAWLIFSAKRLMTYLHVLQQDDYSNARLLKWMFEYKVIDKKLTFVLIIITLVAFGFAGGGFAFISEFLVFAAFVIFAWLERDPRKRAKKNLVATTRAKRIFFPALAILLLAALPILYFGDVWPWIIAVQAIPVSLVFINYLLKPVELSVQRRYWNEAQAKIRALSPTIIAITGSYGKTSVKHILGHILRTQAPTLVTPGSTNTAMGTARVIREDLDESHKYLVVEMGAYGPGSIDKLCALTPPDVGIISSIGHAHYERFKSIETVARSKFELADSVIGRGGMMIVHEKTLKFPYPSTLFNSKKDHFLICFEPVEDGERRKKLAKDNLQIDKITQHKDGLRVTLTYEGDKHVLDVPLYGIHHGHNAALAFATARQLGIEASAIKTALKSLKQIQHRLEVKRQTDGTIIIDDAFNSNPRGFRAALDLLAVMDGAKRRILITPGMVEMGGMHEDAHEKIGLYAGQVCDVALVVAPERIPSFVKGFESSGSGKTLIKVSRFTEAARWISENKRDGDVILIENDLPDMYERVPKI